AIGMLSRRFVSLNRHLGRAPLAGRLLPGYREVVSPSLSSYGSQLRRLPHAQRRTLVFRCRQRIHKSARTCESAPTKEDRADFARQPEKIRQVEMTLHEKPPNATQWSVRQHGRGYSSIQRIWHAHGLKPHLVKTFRRTLSRLLPTAAAIPS